MTPNTAESFDFHVPDSELEDDDAVAPNSKARLARRPPMPADKIIFPRRMLYVEAVLYLLLASAAFGLGYLLGHGRNGNVNPAAKDLAVTADHGARLLGTITFGPLDAKRPDAGAVVIALPHNAWPVKPLATSGFRPDDYPPGPNDANFRALVDLGGNAARASEDGRFSLSLPRTGTYRILVISKHATRSLGVSLPNIHIQEIERYFSDARDLLGRNLYKWPDQARRVTAGNNTIDSDFNPEGVSPAAQSP